MKPIASLSMVALFLSCVGCLPAHRIAPGTPVPDKNSCCVKETTTTVTQPGVSTEGMAPNQPEPTGGEKAAAAARAQY